MIHRYLPIRYVSPPAASFRLWLELCLFILLASRAVAGDPPFRDFGIPNCEISVYRIVENGRTIESRHVITKEKYEGREVYSVKTGTMRMLMERGNLLPILIEKRDDQGTLEFSITYRDNRVHFVYPGPKRNKVEKIPDDAYDLNIMMEVMRCYPFDEEKIKFTLVTEDHIIGAYAKLTGEETVSTPLGDIECRTIEAGISGLMGRVVRTKFLFWIEKEYPYRLVKFVDDERAIDLVGYERN